MTDNADLTALTAELATLRARVDERTVAAPEDPAVSRRHLLRTLAGLGAASAATAVGIAAAEPAAAANGDNLILGQTNTSTATTVLNGSGLSLSTPSTIAVETSGFHGVRSTGSFAGVVGRSEAAGGLGLSGYAGGVDGRAVLAESVHGPTIEAHSDDGVTLRLTPTAAAGPPASVSSQGVGSFSVDADAEVWLKIGAGTPGTWTRLLREDSAGAGRVVPITPIRVLDTRTATGRATGGPIVPGQTSGPLNGLQTVTLDIAGVTPIPDNATGIIGNATVLTPTATGYLRLLPAGATVPASSFNFTTGTTIANGFTSALSPTGLTAIAPISSAIHYHLVLDIAAYIT